MPKKKHHAKLSLVRRFPTTALLVICVLAVCAIVAAVKAPAHARECARYGIVYVHREWPEHPYRTRRCLQWVREATRVYSYERRDDDERERVSRSDQCLATEIDVLSTEHQAEEPAREAARKLWMAKVQWQLGGQYMDLDEAAHVRWRCGPSNAHDTAAGRLSEAAGVLTGKGGQNVRCALWARPCRVERKSDDIRGRK